MDQNENTPFAPQEPTPAPQQPVVPPAPPVQPEQPVYQQPEQPVYQQPVYQQPQQPVYQQPVYQQPQPGYEQHIYQPEQPAPKKKNKLAIILPIVLVVLVAAAVAVYFLFLSGTPIEEISFVGENPSSLAIGDTMKLDYEYLPEDATKTDVTWTSSDDGVATVKNGKVTAVAEGTCTITVTAESGVKDTFKVTVQPPMPEQETRILGTWNVCMTYFDGELEPFTSDQAYMALYADNTGEFILGDAVYSITHWEYLQNTGDNDFYSVTMSELGSVKFAYPTDSTTTLYGKLVLMLDTENMIVFER